jgi:hypothetical protein
MIRRIASFNKYSIEMSLSPSTTPWLSKERPRTSRNYGQPKNHYSLAFPQLSLIIKIDNINGGTHLFEIGQVDSEKFSGKRRGL